MMFSSVDLPQPEAPTRQVKWASGISSVTPSSACSDPRRVANVIETLRATDRAHRSTRSTYGKSTR